MNFNKPICFIDVETTGTDVSKDRIVEIAVLKIDPLGTEEMKGCKINPGILIPKEATAIHGITDEMVAASPAFKQIAKSMLQFIDGCDFAGFNSNRYDYPLLFNEFARAGIIWDYRGCHFIDICNIYKIREERTLTTAVRFYLNREHEGAHGSEQDVKATREVFMSMFEKYSDLPRNMKELQVYSNFGKPMLDLSGNFTLNELGETVFNFGKNKGIVASKEQGYLYWMLKSDFPEDTKGIIKKILFGHGA